MGRFVQALITFLVIFDRFDGLSNHCITTFEQLRTEYNFKKRVAPEMGLRPDESETGDDNMQLDTHQTGKEDDFMETQRKDELIVVSKEQATSALEQMYRFLYSGQR